MSNGRFFNGKSIGLMSGLLFGAVGDVVVCCSIGRFKVDGIEPFVIDSELTLDCLQSIGVMELYVRLKVLSAGARALFTLSDEESHLVASSSEFSELIDDISNGESLSCVSGNAPCSYSARSISNCV